MDLCSLHVSLYRHDQAAYGPNTEHKIVIRDPGRDGYHSQSNHGRQQDQTSQLLADWDPHLDHDPPHQTGSVSCVSSSERGGGAEWCGGQSAYTTRELQLKNAEMEAEDDGVGGQVRGCGRPIPRCGCERSEGGGGRGWKMLRVVQLIWRRGSTGSRRAADGQDVWWWRAVVDGGCEQHTTRAARPKGGNSLGRLSTRRARKRGRAGALQRRRT